VNKEGFNFRSQHPYINNITVNFNQNTVHHRRLSNATTSVNITTRLRTNEQRKRKRAALKT